MKDNWTPINPCILAHDDCVQEIRKASKAKDGKFLGAEPQVIPLPFKCEGSPPKSCNELKLGSVNGQTQYALVISLLFKKAIKRLDKEKAGRVTICNDISDDSETKDLVELGGGEKEEVIEDTPIYYSRINSGSFVYQYCNVLFRAW